jgi:4-aminobutyrate aminotransferase-like enzyme
MDAAWPRSSGEAIHTSTFLGHPVGCAMALANLQEIRVRGLVERSAELGAYLLAALSTLVKSHQESSRVRLHPRGLGLLVGLEVLDAKGSPASEFALAALKALLQRGYIILPEGEHANVLSFTPPLTISRNQLTSAVDVARQILAELAR